MKDSLRVREVTPAERHLKRLMQAWTVLFGVGASVFLFLGDLVLEGGNRIGVLFGLAPMPLPAERFWLSLTVSMMATITALAYTVQKDVMANKRITVFILIAKMTSTLTLFYFFFADAPYFNYLMGSIFCDGPIFVVTFIFYRRAVLSETKNYPI